MVIGTQARAGEVYGETRPLRDPFLMASCSISSLERAPMISPVLRVRNRTSPSDTNFMITVIKIATGGMSGW